MQKCSARLRGVIFFSFQELIGTAAGKLHTGRSRNDQVATDMRLWLVEALDEMRTLMLELIRVHVRRAQQ